jgi:PIN domain nuclease of toxin-antitoxin system
VELSTHLLSDFNRDPADSIIAATAIIENPKLITADKNLRKSKSISTIW